MIGEIWLIVLNHGAQRETTLETLIGWKSRGISGCIQLVLNHGRVLVVRLDVGFLWTILSIVASLEAHQAATPTPWTFFVTRIILAICLISIRLYWALGATPAGVTELMTMPARFLTQHLLDFLRLAVQNLLAILVLHSLDDLTYRCQLSHLQELRHGFDQEGQFGGFGSLDILRD